MKKTFVIIVVLILIGAQQVKSQTTDTITKSSQEKIKEMQGIATYVDYLLSLSIPTIPQEDQKSMLKYLSATIADFLAAEAQNAVLLKENQELKAKLKLLEERKE